jgi:hypothetical protein
MVIPGEEREQRNSKKNNDSLQTTEVAWILMTIKVKSIM